MMIEEEFARARAYRSNIFRYHGLLRTQLTELEREFIQKRLQEELEGLASLSCSSFQRRSEPLQRNVRPVPAEPERRLLKSRLRCRRTTRNGSRNALGTLKY